MPSPREISDDARPGHSVVGWKLAAGSRERLLDSFAPTYPRLDADHVTLRAKVSRDTALPPVPARAEVVGRADDGDGVEALVVALDHGTDRPDGSTWHITWSLDGARRPVESNDVIARCGWTDLAEPIAIELEPARWP